LEYLHAILAFLLIDLYSYGFSQVGYCEVGIELPPKFRLPRVTYNRSHKEREGDEETETALHIRVQGIVGQASERGSLGRSGGQGTGAD